MPELTHENRDGKWLFRYDENNLPALFGQLGRFALDRDLEFDWHDAAVVSQRVQHQVAKAKAL